MTVPTPHIEVTDKSLIAKTVIMPGDPLRAKFIAENFLENPIQFNSIRGMLGYTGSYKGKSLSVMGSGMGMPSIGIYSFELYAFYGVESIIRVGSCGSYHPNYQLYDVVIAKDAWSESTYAKTQNGLESDTLKPSIALNNKIITTAEKLGNKLPEVRVHSSDVFYRRNFDDYKNICDTHGCAVVEMESFALFANANELNKQAACVLTVSDSLVTQEATTSEERQNSFIKMMKLVLEAV